MLVKCDRCDLSEKIQHPCLLGRGCKVNAKIMFIQDAPDILDDEFNMVLAGKPGKQLAKLLENRGIPMNTVYLTSLVKCAVSDISRANLNNCREYLEDEIETVDPDIIVPMGNQALKYCIGRVGLTKVRGNAQEVELLGRTRIILPMINPKSGAIKPAYVEFIRKDCDTLQELYNNGMTQITGVNYRYLETLPDILDELDRLKREAKSLVFDIETTGKSPYMSYSKIVCISLTDKDHYGVVIPLYKHDTPLTSDEVEEVVKSLRELMENPNIPKCAHNGKFDVEWLREWLHINVANFNFDTMLAHYLCISEEQGTQGLKSQAWEFTDMGGYDNELDAYVKGLSDGEGAASRYNYDRVPWNILKTYAAADADCCFRLMQLYKPKIEANPKWATVMNDIMMPGSYTLGEIEANGMKIDMNTTQRYSASYDNEIKQIHERLHAYNEVLMYEQEKRDLYKERERIAAKSKKDRTPEEQKKMETLKKYKDFHINWGSVTQLQELLYERMGLSTSIKTDKGKDSTNEEALTELAEQGQPIPKLLLELRKITTLNNMFIQKLPAMRDPQDVVHSSFNMTGCITGESLIPTSQGLKRIQDLIESRVDGGFVESHMQIVNRYRDLENTSHVVYYANRSTIKITTMFGLTIEGTYNHPILVNYFSQKDITYPNGSVRDKIKAKSQLLESQVWKQLQEITENDLIAIPYGYNIYGNSILQIPSWEMPQRINAKKIKLPTQLTSELAELLGMYYADGCIKSNNGSWAFEICNKDPEVIERVGYLSKQLFDIEPTTHKDDKTKYTHICSIYLAPLENILHIQRGCLNKTIPQFILDAPKSIQIAYLRGMTLDGCYAIDGIKHEFKYCFAREDVARTVQLMLLNMGIISSYREDTTSSNTYEVIVYNAEYAKFRDTIGFVQSKKRDMSYSPVKPRRMYFLDEKNQVVWVRVRHIEKSVSDVYDFTVPGTHSFISNGFVSHNTVTGRLSSESPNFQQVPRKSENPMLFQYHNEPKALFISRFGQDGCIMNADYCLAPDTMIQLINGEQDNIKSICERVTSGEKVYTYSINPKTEEIVVSRIVAGRMTRANEPTLKVTLDNDEVIICSYNHKFLLRNGEYVEAEKLQTGMSLMPFKTSEQGRTPTETYRYIGVNSLTLKEHVEVYKYFHDDYIPGKPIHHKDHNGLNNSPDNLVQVSHAEHRSIHMREFWAKLSPEERSEFVKSHVTEETRKKIGRLSVDWWKSLTPEEYDAFCKKISETCNNAGDHNPMWGKKHSDHALQLMSKKRTKYDMSLPVEQRQFNSKRMYNGRILNMAQAILQQGKELTPETWEEQRQQCYRPPTWKTAVPVLLENGLIQNHKVLKVEPYENMDLYDIEVENNHNFPLVSGIFISNSALEMRIAAVISDDEKMTQALLSGADIHKANASYIFKVPIEEVSKEQRTAAKSLGFGW